MRRLMWVLSWSADLYLWGLQPGLHTEDFLWRGLELTLNSEIEYNKILKQSYKVSFHKEISG
jgi:hypothetical protein